MNNQIITVNLEKEAWNKLQMVSQFVMIPFVKQAEMILTLKLSQELPVLEKSYLIAEVEAVPENFSLLMRSVVKRLFTSNKNEIQSNESERQPFEIKIPPHQFQQLNDLAAANNSDISAEVSRMLTEYLEENYAEFEKTGKT